MNMYEELDFLFGKSGQAYLVTTLPFTAGAVVLYANEAAALLLGVEKGALTGLTAGRLGLMGAAAPEAADGRGNAGNAEAADGREITDGAEAADGRETTGNAEAADGTETAVGAELAGNAADTASAEPVSNAAGQAAVVKCGKYKTYCADFGDDMCLCMLMERQEEGDAPEGYEEYRHKMEDALKAANVASEAKTKFLSEMSHDIRTPMNAIVGMTDIALNYIDDNARVEDCLKKIRTASGHLLALINEVLDMSRIESGKVTIMPEELQLADFIHSILIVIKPQAEKKGQRFHLELENIQYENLVGDPLHLKQIYINVLSNAVKYTPDGGDVWMHVKQEPQEGNRILLFVRVQDNGIGMSPEFVEQIFEPFEREQSVITGNIEGTGLGMSIVKKIVEMMEGDIRVESEKGVGSTFTVRIPLEISGKEDSFQREAFEGRRVLVLQGADEKLEQLPAMLDRLGIAADVAANGMEAVELINEADISGIDYFALLTSDKLDDVEISIFLSEIRERKGSQFPILLFSESDWSAVEYLLKQAGVDSFVPLPLFESRLAQALFPYTEQGKQAVKESEEPAVKFEDCHILLAEDNELNREIATEILRDTGAVIDTAENGKEAVEAFAAKPEFYYDLILMDIQMPLMDGLEAARQIRQMKRGDAAEVHIVAMTANAFAEDRKRSLEAGMNEHITKPLDVHQVMDCLNRWARR